MPGIGTPVRGTDRRSGIVVSGNSDSPGFNPSDPDFQLLAEVWLQRRFGLSAVIARVVAQAAGIGGRL
jgi:hypothetical protein